MAEYKKILIRFPNWIGDLVMALPLIEILKKNYPNAKIHALVRHPFEGLLKPHPDIEKVIHFTLAKRWYQKLNPDKIIQTLKNESYDLAIVCTHSLSSALMIKQAGIPVRIGSDRPFGSWLFSHPVTITKTLHQRKQYLELLNPLDLELTDCLPVLPLDSEKENLVLQKFEKLGLNSSVPYVILHPGASYGAAKTWPVEHFKTLSLRLLEETPLQIVILGENKPEGLQLSHSRFLDFTGKTSLQELTALIKNAAFLVCNDSGPMHLGYALKTPLVALFGATDPIRTGPCGENSDYIFNKTSCGPCFLRSCPLDHRCMKGIHPDAVFQKIQKRLVVYGPS